MIVILGVTLMLAATLVKVRHHGIDVGQPRFNHSVVLLPKKLLPVKHLAARVSRHSLYYAFLIEALPLLNLNNR